MRRAILGLAAACVFGLAASRTDAAPPEAPRRIVSLNLCTDQILLDLVPRERIQALSHLAGDAAVSALYEKAQGIPSTRGEAEAVLAMDPDLVLTGTFSTPATVALLERIGRRVVKVPLASDVDGIKAAVRQIADAVGENSRGEAVIGAFEQWLSQATDAASGEQPAALVYQVNGLASGQASIADAMLKAAGLRNHAAALGLGAGGTLPLETLIANPPDLIVLSGPTDEYRTVTADNLRHPALTALRRERASVIVPWRFWLCGTPYIAEAVTRLSKARASLSERKGQR